MVRFYLEGLGRNQTAVWGRVELIIVQKIGFIVQIFELLIGVGCSVGASISLLSENRFLIFAGAVFPQ